MPVRGVRSIYPPKRGSAKKMFSGTDRSGPHLGLNAKMIARQNSGLRSGNAKGPDERGKRHQKPEKNW